MTFLAPCLLVRRSLPKIWGGSWLARSFDLPPDPAGPLGETWEVYDRPGGSSLVSGGPLSGESLADLFREHGEDLLGRGVQADPLGRFPLLLKFVDAGEPTSIQVHPREVPGDPPRDGGKAEAWVVVHVEEGGWIGKGLREGVTRRDLEAAAGTPAMEDLLVRSRPEPGDAVFLPAGTVHGLGPGVTVFEIQENSDVTYRLYDWGRVDPATGRPRPLHLREAVQTALLDPPGEFALSPEPAGEGAEWLVRCPAFSLRRLVASRPCSLGTEGRCKLITVLDGMGTLGWRSGGAHPPLVLARGRTVLVPACSGAVFLSPVGSITLLVSEPGIAG